MNAETIKDFLVSLGFGIDEAGYEKFESVLTGVTANAIKTGLAVEGAALSVVAFTAKIASGLDNLYWASQRTGATVQGIQSIGYAVSQVGGSVDAARSSLESLSRFVRNNPGAEGFLNRLGVQTRDASGNMRDMAAIFTGVGQKLSSMPYYRANQYAQMLGIDENTLMAMRRGLGQFSAQYSEMTKAIGFNADQAAVSSNRFMTSLKAFGEMAGMARDKIGSNLAEGMAGSIDNLRKRILENFPKIETTITKIVKGILWLGDIVGRVAFRIVEGVGDIIDWWGKLDKETKTLTEVIGGLVVAMRILNSTFWMSPVGLITGLIVALGLLWEDYKTWKEGGNSLIDWEKWQPAIDKAKDALVWLRDHLLELKDSVGGWQKSLELLATFIAGAWISKVTGAFSRLAGIPVPPWLKGWMAYAAYLYDDRENIVASAQSSIDYAKQNIGDGMRALGIDTDFGRNPHTVKGANIQPDIPGAEPVQHGQSVKRPQPTKAGAELLGWMQPMLTNLEHLYRLPEGLLRSVAITESGGNQFAVSGAGAKGLFQFMDGTARDMGLRGNDVFDPEKAAQAAAKYLSQLLRANGGDLSKALASYNWGIGNVQKHGMALMPQETRNYIPKVLSNMPAPGAQVQQQNTYHIYGGGDPHSVGNQVERRQQSANAQLMRGNQTKVG
ncbi:lytic transglycosylase [Salmonella enterica]|nr:lytic transglycosylase [Salmonella enterica]ECC7178416.1 lytic transglycosylase [Salmonella enterica]EHF7707779.1 transglycosylase SLT domain-containing protein [Salmonella enterica]